MAQPVSTVREVNAHIHHSSNSSIQSHSHAAASSTAAAITSNDWIFTRRDLETNTPSRHDGMTEETELDRRTRGCVFIATVGLALELPQYAITSAEVYFHRYFIRESFKQHQHIDVAAACLFLATKVEEQGRKLSTVIAVCAQKAAKNDNLRIDDTTREFWRWRDRITLYEELVLSSLCFDLNVDQPYELILKLGNEMKLSDSVKTAAMAFVNDGYRTTWLCLMYRAKEIGLAALFVASIFVGQELVSSTSEAVTFFQLHEVQPRNVFEAAELLVKAHSNSSGDGGPGGGNGASKSNHSPVVRDPGPPPRRTVS
ncbi:cyclin-like protein [Zopfochytrium polystomum]|nr:cyclin-like protein [Zopfochytrium polystomum]